MADAWKCLYCNWTRQVDVSPEWIAQNGVFRLWNRILTLHAEFSPNCKVAVREIVRVPLDEKAVGEVV